MLFVMNESINLINVQFWTKLQRIVKYSETSIKWTPIKQTPFIKRTLSQVPKQTSDISLYNEPLFSRHLYWVDEETKISCIWLISIVKNLY